MRWEYLNKLLIAVCLFFNIQLSAQTISNTSINSGGGESSEMTFCVGNLLIEDLSGDNVSLGHGVSQMMLVITALDHEVDLPVVNVFPNPTADYLTIDYGANDIFDYQIYDAYGKFIIERETMMGVQRINMSAYKAGLYYLKVVYSNTESYNFKILKTNK